MDQQRQLQSPHLFFRTSWRHEPFTKTRRKRRSSFSSCGGRAAPARRLGGLPHVHERGAVRADPRGPSKLERSPLARAKKRNFKGHFLGQCFSNVFANVRSKRQLISQDSIEHCDLNITLLKILEIRRRSGRLCRARSRLYRCQFL